jgi:hypothetical protein
VFNNNGTFSNNHNIKKDTLLSDKCMSIYSFFMQKNYIKVLFLYTHKNCREYGPISKYGYRDRVQIKHTTKKYLEKINCTCNSTR